ncbi:glucuronyl hydrolase [Filimonas effusa]|uniref:Glucuronyl hydrolase n=2 Tax=Filimonas effusa TaxID=2508721 RepID=A0A4Q1DEN1_9BACT|nr:glucuronyl hydrolase [Filimonas effusa]
MKKKLFITLLPVLLAAACAAPAKNDALAYCKQQATKTLATLPAPDSIPRSIANGQQAWKLVNYKDWTSGFWTGICWYLYEYSGEAKWKNAAIASGNVLIPLTKEPVIDHDLGFQLYCSIGNGYRLTGDSSYRSVLLAAADSLATLFNPSVGTILSWPRAVPGMDWPRHNTIMDNMMNLELLFWAARNGGQRKLYDIAVSHATTTMKNHFRPDYTSYHVVLYDTLTGKKLKAVTHQGYADNSMWARGQSWAIYGFTMVYRETKDPVFLNFAQKVTDVYLQQLPDDLIPFWDFNDPAIPNAPRDASAAAVTASALLELSSYIKDPPKARMYKSKAEQMLASLSAAAYQSRERNNAFLLHSTGHKPNGGEIDASIIYADYYYLEALLRWKKRNN